MSITIVGYITRDTLIYPRASWQVLESLGGALYTVIALASLTETRLNLVSNAGRDVYDTVLSTLARFPHVNTSGIRRIEQPHYHCYILFASEYGTQYDEIFEVPLTFSQVQPFISDSEFILVTPMTGFELDLDTLRQIRAAAVCPVYLDYHILALDRDPLGNRFLQRRADWFEWCVACKHLQLNYFEAKSLGFCLESTSDMLSFAEPMLDRGVRSVSATLGPRGVLVAWKCKGEPRVRWIEPMSVPAVIDPTGCGDVFAGAFIVSMLRTDDIVASYEFANKVAGLKCTVRGIDGLSETLQQALGDIECNTHRQR